MTFRSYMILQINRVFDGWYLYIHIYWEKNDFNANMYNLCFEVDFIY